MSITAQQVNALRQRTGISMMACKKALEETGGDEEKAIDILRKRGEAKAVTKAGRETKEGIIVSKVSNGKAVMVTLYCETDFVSKNEEFISIAENAATAALEKGKEGATEEADIAIKALFTKLGENMSIEIEMLEGEGLSSYTHTNRKIGTVVSLKSSNDEMGKDIAMHITAMNPLVISPTEVSDGLVAKEREIWIDQLKNEGKPEEILEKIMMGKENKFRSEAALLKQTFVKDPEKTIEQLLGDNEILSFIRKAI